MDAVVDVVVVLMSAGEGSGQKGSVREREVQLYCSHALVLVEKDVQLGPGLP